MRTCLTWRLITQLFACGGRSDSLKAQQGLGERVPERHHY